VNGLSLFAGIGGLDLGLERAGINVVGQVEIDPWRRRVLATHWPEVPRHDDVRTAVEWWCGEERPRVDLVFGGFPCQDTSDAGRRAGIEGEQSRLWAAMAATIRGLRPRYVLVENTTGLLARGMGRVLGDLAALGFDVEWDCVPAAAVDAPHLRARLWLLAYPCRVGDEAHHPVQAGWPVPVPGPGWDAEPDVGRVADGLPRGVAGRLLRPLGDAAVSQVAEHVGRLLLGLDGRAGS
jgi:DNA (cytosine-5)-methyltransferase 1